MARLGDQRYATTEHEAAVGKGKLASSLCRASTKLPADHGREPADQSAPHRHRKRCPCHIQPGPHQTQPTPFKRKNPIRPRRNPPTHQLHQPQEFSGSGRMKMSKIDPEAIYQSMACAKYEHMKDHIAEFILDELEHDKINEIEQKIFEIITSYVDIPSSAKGKIDHFARIDSINDLLKLLRFRKNQ
jgi:hypothetical protein